ncbi:MAG: S8 family serine peptidase [Limnobacter sp.]|uniref:S8 family peptidase n=1 Tax=Limnobacter sp. TaxID=2003368 RepID=UPI003919E10A
MNMFSRWFKGGLMALAYAACVALVLTGQSAVAQTPEPSSPQFIIKLRNAVELSSVPSVRRMEKEGEFLSAVMSRNNVDAVWLRAGTLGSHVMRFGPGVRTTDYTALINRLASDPEVDTVMIDRPVRMQATPNDTSFSSQWALRNTSGTAGAKFNLAWDLIRGSSKVVVAVLDTGVVFQTPELVGRLLAGYDFVSDVATANDGNGRDADASDPGNWITSAEAQSGQFQGCSVRDSSWHGTFVAGQIAANANNASGVAGADWNVKVLPVRVMGKCGGYLSDVVDAMVWAAGLDVPGVPTNTTPASVINLSLGSSATCSGLEQNAINRVTAAGTLVVASAGNGGGAVEAPANCTNVISVGALDRNGARAYYSALGTGLDLMAPGGYFNGLLGVGNSGTTGPASANQVEKVGTSFASPLVAATAGLIKAINPALTPAQITTLIVSNTASFLSPGSTTCQANSGSATCNCTTAVCGSGMLDAYAAVLAARGTLPLANASVSANGLGTSGYQESAVASNPVLLRGSDSTAISGRTIASYSWTQVSGTSVLTGTSASADLTLPAPNATTDLVFKLTVTDSVGQSHSSFTSIRMLANGDTGFNSASVASDAASGSSGSSGGSTMVTSAPSTGGGGGGGGGGGSLAPWGLVGLAVLLALWQLQARRLLNQKRQAKARIRPDSTPPR